MTLYQRLAAVFAALLLACCGATVWLQMRASMQYEDELTQRLSLGLAAHIASNSELMPAGALNDAAVHGLFDKLMAVNPAVEVYLLSPQGRIVAHAAPPGQRVRETVDLEPVQRLLAGAPLPVVGDDPRSPGARKVFSAAPLKSAGADVGYVYVVLSGQERDQLGANLLASHVWRSALWSMALVALLVLLAGLAAFHLITRPMRQLTRAVSGLEASDLPALEAAAPALARVSRGTGEIAALGAAFSEMTARIARQWREAAAQEQQRRELFANISHDLRTPLTSLHGYLETLQVKAATLSGEERERYLAIALGQSAKVGRLAQELFDLARLEYGVVETELESFAMTDLVQEVFQKFELAARARRQQLKADIPEALASVQADFGLIERVLTNLLDNAIRHTPEGGEITVRLRDQRAAVAVEVSDTGPGIPQDLRSQLFVRPLFTASGQREGGLGLVIVRRILQLHGSEISLTQGSQGGAVFSFALSAAPGNRSL
ncbi:MAG TPA: ATP-binding protein [Ramlibacter sp.]|nr:ATP-binding protein [Ramlibacter sp.]